jgi:two-component system, NtrC family, sensor kinase
MNDQAKSPVVSARSFSLQTKFSVGIITILGLFTGLLSYGLYKQLEDSLIKNVYEKSEIILAELEATRNYVAYILRPKISSLIPSDEFILEAMSTSYVSRQIMERFQKSFPEFRYKRAAIDSRGALNEADAFEREILSRFRGDPRLTDWQGLVTRNRQRFFVRMVPIRMEAACLHCHGERDKAPAKLIALYGPHRGFGRKPEDIAGMDVLSFPVESAMGQITRRTIAIVGPGIAAILAASLLVIVFFKRLVVNRIALLKGFFSEFVSDGSDLSRRINIVQQDEIGAVCRAFNRMADRLNDLMKERTDLLQESISQREKIRSIFDGITDKLMLVAPDHAVLMANSASMVGRESPMEQSKCYNLIHGLDAPCGGCLLDRTLQEKIPTFGELSHPDGETYLAHFYPILDKRTGEVESVVHYCKSITEKKRMDQQMMHAEKLASLGQLVAGVAHELNNPLGLILFYVELLKKELPPESEHVPDVEVIARHSETCRSVVQDLLEFSRNVETVRVPGELNDTVAKVISVLDKQFAKDGIQVKKSLDPNLPMIHLNESKLQQVWMNLLLNAKQAIKTRNGLITVTTRHDKTTGMASVIIEDNGEGMSPEIIHKIFDPFFTTKKDGEGTGLGLSVSYGIIKEHGGNITVKSRPAVGSVFEVLIPEKIKGRDYGEQRRHA